MSNKKGVPLPQHAYKNIQNKIHIRDKLCHGICQENRILEFLLELFNKVYPKTIKGLGG